MRGDWRGAEDRKNPQGFVVGEFFDVSMSGGGAETTADLRLRCASLRMTTEFGFPEEAAVV